MKVIVRRGDIFRRFSQFHFVKMNPYVEVLLGEAQVGTVPAATGADLQPVWNHQLPAQEFEIGQELHFRVLDRNNWPRKDVLIGGGSVRLAAELVGPDRRSVDLTVQLTKKHAGEKPEVTGSVNVSITFLGFPAGAGAATEEAPPAIGTASGITEDSAPLPPPPSPPPSSMQASPGDPLAADVRRRSSRGSASSGSRMVDGAAPAGHTNVVPEQAAGQRRSGNRALHFEEPGAGNPPDDASVASSSRPPAQPADPVKAEKQRHLVLKQYYGREVRKQSWRPVLCTDGVYGLWRRWRCSRSACGAYACAGGTVAAGCAISWVASAIW